MAITDNTKPAAAATTAAFNMDANQNTGAAAAAPVQRAQAPSRTFGSLSHSPIGRYSGSEAVKSLENKLAEVYKSQDISPSLEWKMIPLDNQNNPGLAYGILLFCLVNKDKAPDAVAVHTLILEATSAPLPPRQTNEAGVQVEVMNPPSAAWDATLVQAVNNAVSQTYRNKRVMIVEATVVPRTFNASIPTELHKLAYNTINACSTEIDMRTPGFQDVNLQEIQKGNLTVGLTVTNKQDMDDVGLPMRTSVEIVYQDNVNPNSNSNNQQYSVNTQDRATLIGVAGGFIDFTWAPALTATGFGQMYQQQALPQGLLPSHKFAARLVITNINPVAAATPPAVLNLLAPVISAVENMNWVQAFLSRGVKSKAHDIGALNIEGNFNGAPDTVNGPKVETHGDNFGIDKLYAFVASLVRPGVAISFDVPDAGPQSWFLSVFAQAANGSPSATEAILNAANTLTNGNFGRAFPVNGKVFVDTGNRVHMGTIESTPGVLEDLRMVDYLAVANSKGIENPDYLRRYTDTFQAVDFLSLNRRLDVRASIIREVAPTAVFTGMATRCTLAPEFVTALWAGIKACGVSPTVTTHGMTTGPQVNRASASFVNDGLVMPGTIHAFNQGQQTSINRLVGGQSFTGRW